MKLCFHNLPGPFSEGTRRLLASKNCQADETGMPVFLEAGSDLQVKIADGKASVIYPQGGFFRALGLLLAHVEEKTYCVKETPRLEKLGLQIDFSRNAPLRVDAAKKWMDMLALMGYNQLYLYMEDMYCLPSREYFGYMRGRYTPQELKELDDYADQYGIELIPSIQTLGHMEQYLRWDEAAEVRDTARELLADSQTTLDFVEEMLKAATAPFRTKKVVLGLDEAHNLGLGKYLDRNGYVKKEEIFYRHLDRVFQITDKLGLEGMIYSDMFFRMAAPDAGYYHAETVIPPEIAEKIPKNATLIYWHYGEAPGCDDHMAAKHVALGRKTVFYGGTWTWCGHLPHTEYAIRATREGLDACHKYGIREAVQTIWGDDDGMSCLHQYSLLTLQDMAEYAYGHTEDAWLAERFRFCTEGDLDAFRTMSDYQCKYKFGELSNNFMELFRGKTLFWQDILMGQADEYLQKNPMSAFYGQRADKFAKIVAECDTMWKKHYAYIENVFRFLAIKCEIAEKLEPAYKCGDRDTLANIVKVQLPALLELTVKCHEQHKKLWMESNKTFGSETLDHHYGGMEARIRTACDRLEAYLSNELPCLEELEEKRLPMMVNPWNTIRRIATTTTDF